MHMGLVLCHLSNEKNLVVDGLHGDYTTQLYGDNNNHV